MSLMGKQIVEIVKKAIKYEAILLNKIVLLPVRVFNWKNRKRTHIYMYIYMNILYTLMHDYCLCVSLYVTKVTIFNM